MKVAKISIIKSDWTDKDNPTRQEVLTDNNGSFYFLDDIHNVRVWVTFESFIKKEKKTE
jgi:hypothetical protein